MREGLYKVQFQTKLGMGYGVVYAKDGHMWGGDSGMFYAGTYREADGKLTAEVDVDRHTKNPAIPASVFGVDKANITLVGKVNGDTVTTTGTAKQAPGIEFQAILTFLRE